MTVLTVGRMVDEIKTILEENRFLRLGTMWALMIKKGILPDTDEFSEEDQEIERILNEALDVLISQGQVGILRKRGETGEFRTYYWPTLIDKSAVNKNGKHN